MDNEFLDQIERLAEQHSRFRKEAYLFIYDALQHTVSKLGKASLPREQRHISGRDLLQGISEYGLEQFGPLTRMVFAHWGVNATQDFGTMDISPSRTTRIASSARGFTLTYHCRAGSGSITVLHR